MSISSTPRAETLHQCANTSFELSKSLSNTSVFIMIASGIAHVFLGPLPVLMLLLVASLSVIAGYFAAALWQCGELWRIEAVAAHVAMKDVSSARLADPLVEKLKTWQAKHGQWLRIATVSSLENYYGLEEQLEAARRRELYLTNISYRAPSLQLTGVLKVVWGIAIVVAVYGAVMYAGDDLAQQPTVNFLILTVIGSYTLNVFGDAITSFSAGTTVCGLEKRLEMAKEAEEIRLISSLYDVACASTPPVPTVVHQIIKWLR